MPNINKIKCVIVDDELPAREILQQYINGVESLELTGSCSNAVEALSFLQSNSVDLLFLDIQMPHIFGTNFIRALKNPPKVIFTTAYRKYAIEGFELDAVDYLLKPISFDRFLKAVNKLMHVNIQNNQNQNNTIAPPESTQPFLYFRADRKMVKVLFNEILYIEGLRDYVKIHTISKIIITKHQLATLEEMLPKDAFLRVHRSYIVAAARITSYNNDTIEIEKTAIPIGRLFRHDVSKVLNISAMKNGTKKQSTNTKDKLNNENENNINQ